MCQISTSKKMSLLKKPVIVYKMGYERPGGMVTGYQNYLYYFGKLEQIPVENIQKNMDQVDEEEYKFSIGFHAFTNKRQAISLAKENGSALFICVIPAGSYVNRGTWDCDDYYNSIVSNQIFLNNKIEL